MQDPEDMLICPQLEILSVTINFSSIHFCLHNTQPFPSVLPLRLPLHPHVTEVPAKEDRTSLTFEAIDI